MLITILVVLGFTIFEHISLKAYRTFNTLPDNVKKYNFWVMWISSAVIIILLFVKEFGVVFPGLLFNR